MGVERTKKYSNISLRIPLALKRKLILAVVRHGYINESDFVREAIRTHIFALERAEQGEK